MRSLTNNSFKTFLITLLSLTLLFSISCSNEDTTGGGNTFSDIQEGYNNTNTITVISQTSSSVYSAGTIEFFVYGVSDYNVSIESVNNGSNPLSLEPSDFSYDKSSKKLTLSSSGLTKFQSSSASLTAKQKYQYAITFKFETSSDSKIFDVNVNLIKAEVITKTEIEAMIKSMGTIYIPATNMADENKKANFDFSASTFSSSVPNFNAKIGKAVDASYYTYSGRIYTLWALEKTENFKKYFSYSGSVSSLLQRENDTVVDGANLTFYYTFRLKEGYALSDEVAHITSDGLSIRLILSRAIGTTQSWVK